MDYAFRLYDRRSPYPEDDAQALIAYVVFSEDGFIPKPEWWDEIDFTIQDIDPRGDYELGEVIRMALDEGDLEYDYIEDSWEEGFDPSGYEVIDVPVTI